MYLTNLGNDFVYSIIHVLYELYVGVYEGLPLLFHGADLKLAELILRRGGKFYVVYISSLFWLSAMKP